VDSLKDKINGKNIVGIRCCIDKEISEFDKLKTNFLILDAID